MSTRPDLTVIVPVLNEVRIVTPLIDSLRYIDANFDTIVVDGGSNDGTLEAASRHAELWPKLRVVTAPRRGRARQMNYGARQATGEVLLFLHVDTQLPPRAIEKVIAAVHDGADFGYFPVEIESRDPRLTLVAKIMSARSRAIVSSTGDQAQFFRRSFFFEVGGFTDVPLLEDLIIMKHAGRAGRRVCMPDPVRTSARRWEAQGVNETIVRMATIRTLYHLGVRPERLAKYYR
jgi:rSAM/selenodomain-associated transferase 2